MSAHSHATIQTARERVQAVIDRLNASDSPLSQHWAYVLEQALLRPTGGTLSGFLARHDDGQGITTFQVVIDVHDGTLSSAWCSPERSIVDLRPTYVKWSDGSQRYLAGVTTLTADDIYVGFAKFGDDAVQLVAYC